MKLHLTLTQLNWFYLCEGSNSKLKVWIVVLMDVSEEIGRTWKNSELYTLFWVTFGFPVRV